MELVTAYERNKSDSREVIRYVIRWNILEDDRWMDGWIHSIIDRYIY